VNSIGQNQNRCEEEDSKQPVLPRDCDKRHGSSVSSEYPLPSCFTWPMQTGGQN
jgi:hypothetical protein